MNTYSSALNDKQVVMPNTALHRTTFVRGFASAHAADECER